jgi:hypothetical protein
MHGVHVSGAGIIASGMNVLGISTLTPNPKMRKFLAAFGLLGIATGLVPLLA